jgi:hypothetical protein
MAGSIADQSNFGAYFGTTNVWDVSRLYEVDVKSPEFKELLVRLYQNINNISTLLNLKDTGYYALTEFINSQSFFNDPAVALTTVSQPAFRQVFRKVINFGALPNTATKSVAHGIAFGDTFTTTRIYGSSSDTTGHTYIPLPYASPTDANEIELNVDATNVNVTTGSNRTNFTVTYIILEYLKQ